jgi:hypothetical protein
VVPGLVLAAAMQFWQRLRFHFRFGKPLMPLEPHRFTFLLWPPVVVVADMPTVVAVVVVR